MVQTLVIGKQKQELDDFNAQENKYTQMDTKG